MPPTPPEPLARPAVRTALLIGAFVAVALGLRVYDLADGLWYDEIETLVDHARLPAGEILTSYRTKNHHPLYGLLAHFGMAVFGDGPFGLRLPAAVFGTASVWAVFHLGRRVAGLREGVLAALLLTVSYHHVWFSQNARGYTGLLFFSLVGTALFHGLLTDSAAGRRTLLGYGLVMGLAAYTHITAVFISIAHALVGIATLWRSGARAGSPGRRALLGLGASALIGLALYAPVLGQLLETLIGPNPYAADTAWERPGWMLLEVGRGLARGLPGGWVALAAGLAVAGAGFLSYAKADRAVAALFVLPVVLTAGAVIALGHNLWPRFFFFAMGFAVLIAIRGALVLGRWAGGPIGERIATAGVAVAAAGSALTVPRAYHPKQDYEAARRFVEARATADDAIGTADLTNFPYRYYYRLSWPSLAGAAALDSLEHGHARTFVLTTFPIRLTAVHPDLWDRLAQGYDTAAVFPGTVGGGDIVVWESRPRSGTTEPGSRP
ncbi:MAG: glycosyltransferase family 39 protein [Gemmatimonadales bacterium]